MSDPWSSPAAPAAQEAAQAALADVELRPFWQSTVPSRESDPPLEGHGHRTGLAIVGGGFTGLWAALYAKELDPDREVTILEATRCGDGASSRNGGFLQASLTHGIANGATRFPDEIGLLERLGLENFEALGRDLARYGIDAELEDTGALDVAVAAHELPLLREIAETARAHGHEVELLGGDGVRALLDSPLYLGGVWDRTGAALVNPAKLVDGLRRAALAAGVRIHEHSPVLRIEPTGPAGGPAEPRVGRAGLTLTTTGGQLRARKLLLATSAYPSLLARIGRYVAPVYDYALMSEPLSDAQLGALGWRGRQGVGDLGNRFHYYRLSADNRILWGGYDAVYRYGGPVDPGRDDHGPTFAKLARHFFRCFPQLEGIRFSHRWGGAIDTCSRFAVFFGTAHHGDLAYALGYTGLGVGASRFGARTALDLLDGRRSEATATRFVSTRPLPFPPEPLRFAVIQLTRNRLAAADRNGGRRGLWLRALDRAGLGFDS